MKCVPFLYPGLRACLFALSSSYYSWKTGGRIAVVCAIKSFSYHHHVAEQITRTTSTTATCTHWTVFLEKGAAWTVFLEKGAAASSSCFLYFLLVALPSRSCFLSRTRTSKEVVVVVLSRRRRKVQSQICVGGSETCVWKDDDNALLDPFLFLLVFDFLTPPPPCAFLNAVVFQNKLSCAVPCRATANENKRWFVVVALSKVCTIFAVDM